MNHMKQLALIGLSLGVVQVACADGGAVAAQAAQATPAASLHEAAVLPGGTTSRQPHLNIKRDSKLTKVPEGSVQVDSDTYTTTTEFVHVTTVYVYNLGGELVDMKMSEIRTPRT